VPTSRVSSRGATAKPFATRGPDRLRVRASAFPRTAPSTCRVTVEPNAALPALAPPLQGRRQSTPAGRTRCAVSADSVVAQISTRGRSLHVNDRTVAEKRSDRGDCRCSTARVHGHVKRFFLSGPRCSRRSPNDRSEVRRGRSRSCRSTGSDRRPRSPRPDTPRRHHVAGRAPRT